MIARLHIERLRGIQSGELSGLFPLTVLVGPNNSGKSTCLEAAAIALGGESVIDQIVTDRGWLGLSSLDALVGEQTSLVQADLADNANGWASISRRLQRGISVTLDEERSAMAKELSLPLGVIQIHAGMDRPRPYVVDCLFGSNGNSINIYRQAGIPQFTYALLGVATPPGALEDALAQLDGLGEAAHVRLLEHLRAVDRALRDVRAIKRGDRWIVHAIYEHSSVPLAVAGDGVKRLFRLAGALAAVGTGIALLEEPEAFQHPRAVEELCDVLWSAVDGGTQAILTTHSIELFDILARKASEKDGRLERLGVFRLRLADGVLRSARLPGAEAITLRSDLLEDLRS